MARHKDINHVHALLEGEGWHIENVTRQRSTNRKDKRRCVNYDKINKKCKNALYCVGSSNCAMYREY